IHAFGGELAREHRSDPGRRAGHQRPFSVRPQRRHAARVASFTRAVQPAAGFPSTARRSRRDIPTGLASRATPVRAAMKGGAMASNRDDDARVGGGDDTQDLAQFEPDPDGQGTVDGVVEATAADGAADDPQWVVFPDPQGESDWAG